MAMPRVACWDSRCYEFDASRTALLVIDMQKDFLGVDSSIVSEDKTGNPLSVIVPTVSSVLSAARSANLKVIHTREGYDAEGGDVTPYKRSLNYVGRPGPYGPFLVRGAPGHDFCGGVQARTRRGSHR